MKELLEEDDYAIPMTPMIDIVFQMLIFFLLATSIQEEERDLVVNLPSGTQGAQRGAASGTRLVIGVRRDGSATLGGNVIEWSDLRSKLVDAGRAKDKPKVFIRADKDAVVERLAAVFQLCAEAQLSTIDFEYRYAPKAGGP